MTDETGKDTDLAVHVAWLSYVGGHTQADIAARLGLSRAKVHRLIAQAYDAGYVHVFVDHAPQHLIRLGDAIRVRYGLANCIVVPDVGDGASAQGCVAALGSAAARQLTRRLDRGEIRTLGVSWGRSLAEMARRLPRARRADLTVVSVIGSLTRKSAINPFDVVHRLTDATESPGFFLPVPFIVDSVRDKQILMQQRSVRDALAAARRAEVCYLGIGSIHRDQPMFVASNGLLDPAAIDRLERAGVKGEIVGHFLCGDGRKADLALNEQTIGLSLDELREREAVGIAGGRDKVAAIRAVLEARVLKGLIVDENAAAALCRDAHKAA